jgi:FtsP/CotA-like multicopper oxidase with cupredoxin domain
MNFKHKIAGLPLAAWLLATPLVMALPAQAAEYWLRAGTTTVTLPDANVVTMWGYASCTDGTFATCAAVSVPGPALTVPAADAGLTVHLRNTLTVPTSLVIPGQITAMTPVWDDGTSGARTTLTQRVRSFTNEAAANGGTADYVWANVKPGTYLYQSGTQTQVQVQMGLYGSLTKNAVEAVAAVSPAQAYAGVTYDNQITLLYSEIDPALHAAVAGGTYGTAAGPTSTLNYNPKYFLVNGKPYTSNTAPFAVTAGQRTLLRFLNAGLKTHVPVLNGMHMDMVAEDGNLYPFSTNPRKQYSAFLPAAKTMDAIVVATSPADGSGKYAIMDRRLDLTNGTSQDGGMLAFLAVAAPVGGPPVISSVAPLAATQNAAYSYQVVATDPASSVLSYSLVSAPAGMTINSATGLIAWTPTNAQAVPATPPRTQAVTVKAANVAGLSASQSFTVTVANVNDAPVAVNDSYTMIQGTTPLVVPAPGVLGNDSDPDGTTPTATAFSTPACTGFATPCGTLTTNSNGSFSYTPRNTNFIGAATFTYQASDGLLSSNVATVTVNVIANRPPVAVNDTLSAPKCSVATTVVAPAQPACRTTGTGAYTPVLLAVLSNDTDPDTAIASTNKPTTAVISTGPNAGGTAVAIANMVAWPVGCPRTGTPAAADVGKICYTPKLNFKGTEIFSYRARDNLNAQSGNIATVRVTVQ